MFRRGVHNDLRNFRYCDWTKHRQIGRSSWLDDSGGRRESRTTNLAYFAVNMLTKSSAVCKHEMDFGASRSILFTFDHNSWESPRLVFWWTSSTLCTAPVGNSEGNETASFRQYESMVCGTDGIGSPAAVC